jgi:hypothetical protein
MIGLAIPVAYASLPEGRRCPAAARCLDEVRTRPSPRATVTARSLPVFPQIGDGTPEWPVPRFVPQGLSPEGPG